MTPDLFRAIDTLLAEIRERPSPVVVAVDGPSGAGKSTLVAQIATAVGAAVVSVDDFFAATVPAAGWAHRSAAARARDAIDWRRLRREALEPLRAGMPARWYPFDFAAGPLPDGTYRFAVTAIACRPSSVILLDGAYSARPELRDLVDLAVLVDAPTATRRARLAAREEPGFLEGWHARWDEAEAYYFQTVRPASTFDLVVSGVWPPGL